MITLFTILSVIGSSLMIIMSVYLMIKPNAFRRIFSTYVLGKGVWLLLDSIGLSIVDINLELYYLVIKGAMMSLFIGSMSLLVFTLYILKYKKWLVYSYLPIIGVSLLILIMPTVQYINTVGNAFIRVANFESLSSYLIIFSTTIGYLVTAIMFLASAYRMKNVAQKRKSYLLGLLLVTIYAWGTINNSIINDISISNAIEGILTPVLTLSLFYIMFSKLRN